MFDTHTRSLVTYEHLEQLRSDARAPARARARRHGARRRVGDRLIRLGEWLTQEPAPPCREVSSRA
jgi:hypothetical protein